MLLTRHFSKLKPDSFDFDYKQVKQLNNKSSYFDPGISKGKEFCQHFASTTFLVFTPQNVSRYYILSRTLTVILFYLDSCRCGLFSRKVRLQLAAIPTYCTTELLKQRLERRSIKLRVPGRGSHYSPNFLVVFVVLGIDCMLRVPLLYQQKARKLI